MAIHIDIIAHLNQRKLMMEGEQLKRMVDSLVSDTNRTLEKGALGRNSKIIASNNKVLNSYDQMVNAGDAATLGRNREADAEDKLTKAKERAALVETKLSRARAPKSIERWTAAKVAAAKKLEAAENEVAAAGRARLRLEQAGARSARDFMAAQKAGVEVKQKQRQADADAAVELQKLTSVQDRAKVSLSSYTTTANLNAITLRREMTANKGLIESTRGMRRGFDSATESVIRYRTEHNKTIDMMASGKATSSALEAQLNRTGVAYRNMERNVRDATASLREHLVEEAKSATRSPFGRGGRRMPDPAGALARNLGALTPLGTVTPGLLLPLGAGFFAIAQGAIAASQSLLLLPAALTAAGAGFGVMQMATMGVSDALTAMMDLNNPEKFAESLRLLSPAAQQFALSIQQLVPTFMELKNVVQDTFFAGMPQLVNDLTRTYRDSFGGMAIGVAGAFNGIFMKIGDVLQDPRAQQSVGIMFDGIVKTFQALIPLVGSLTQVFVQLSSTGAQVLPTVIDDISNIMAKFSDFISEAAASGDLATWMTEGWEALKAFGSVVVYAGKMLYEVFGLHGPKDIERFKSTMFGLIDGFGFFLATLRKFFEGLVGFIRGITNSGVGQFIGSLIDKVGGLESALAALAGIGLFVKLGFSFYKFYKIVDEGIKFLLMRIGLLNTGMAALPAAAGAAGSAAGAAAAGGLAGAGAKAGSGFAETAKKAIKLAGWVGLGVTIAELLEKGLRDGGGGWRDALADGLDPGKVLNPSYWAEKIFGEPDRTGMGPLGGGGGSWGGPDAPPGGPTAPTAGTGSVMGSDGKPYEPVQPGTPGAVPIPGKNQWGTPGRLGSASSGGREPDRPFDFSEIPGIPAGGFPVPVPNPGGGPKPNIPYDQYSLQSIPLGQFDGAKQALPDPRSLMSQLTPNQLSQKGYGYQVDPQGVFDAESRLQQQRAAVEEARARVLELAQDNQATEQDKLKAQNNIVEAERSFLKSQVDLLEAQRGTWKKINETISDQGNLLEGLGAEIDADFGISKGLPGIAENITKFLANIVAAPVYGALAGVRGAGGDLGGGKGLFGAAALSGTFGPQFMQPAPSTPVSPAATVPGAMLPGASIPGASIPGATPLRAEAGYTAPVTTGALNPNNVNTAGLKPQAMALLSHIQSLPQFKDIPLTSAKVGREGDEYPWHPSGTGLDFGVNAYLGSAQSALGDQLNKYLNDNKEMFGINHTLWKTMQGGDHFNHLHVGLNGSGNNRPDTSPLLQNQALKGLTPPSAGGGSVTDPKTSVSSLGSIPIPLPVTIVGGGAGSAGLPGITPPAGTPGSPLSPGTAPGASTPSASAPGGMRTTEQAELDRATSSWKAMSPTARASAVARGEYKPDGTPIIAPSTPAAGGLPANLPSPGQGMPTPWTLPPLTPPGVAGAAAPPLSPGYTPPAGPGGPPLAPGGYAPPGTGPTQIGAAVGPPVGTGSGFAGVSGGLLGAASSAIGMAAGAAGTMGGGPAAGAASSAIAQMGIEQLNRAIAFGGQAAGIGVSGLMEALLPTGGSELANNSWLTKILGGIVGARPLLPNFANVSGAADGVQAGQQAAGNPQQPGAPVNVTQNNYNQNANSATSDLERLATNAAAAPMAGMGAGR